MHLLLIYIERKGMLCRSILLWLLARASASLFQHQQTAEVYRNCFMYLPLKNYMKYESMK